MDSRTLERQIKSGFMLAGKTLFAIAVAGAFFGGIARLRLHEAPDPYFFVQRHPLFLVITATAILVLTTNRWVKILPGVLAYGTLGGLIMIGSGQYNHVAVPRSSAIALTLFCIASSALALSFAQRPLTLMDRLALMAFLFCCALSMSSGNEVHALMVPIGVGFLVLLTAWAINLISARDDDGGPPAVEN